MHVEGPSTVGPFGPSTVGPSTGDPFGPYVMESPSTILLPFIRQFSDKIQMTKLLDRLHYGRLHYG